MTVLDISEKFGDIIEEVSDKIQKVGDIRRSEPEFVSPGAVCSKNT
ncbi:hypothetical protein [Bacillus sp. FJAT-27445]|nr:hypothetical protein [Bacillus sp. FJAT-27445]